MNVPWRSSRTEVGQSVREWVGWVPHVCTIAIKLLIPLILLMTNKTLTLPDLPVVVLLVPHGNPVRTVLGYSYIINKRLATTVFVCSLSHRSVCHVHV